MSIRIYLLSLFLTICGSVIWHYKNKDLPLPIIGDVLGEDGLIPLHCMFFTAALIATWLNIETGDWIGGVSIY